MGFGFIPWSLEQGAGFCFGFHAGCGPAIVKDMDERALTFAGELCKYAGKDEEFLKRFVDKLNASPALFKEFLYYLDNQDFLCEMNICGITVPDILVWQVDKFKSGIDEGRFELKYNADAMLLMAFDTMYEVERDPSKYLENFRTVTGSDYEDKIKGY